MAYRIDYKCLAEHWPLDEWPDQLSVYHQLTPNDKRAYVPKRTCQNVSKWPADDCLKCSECGCVAEFVSLEEEPFMMLDGVAVLPRYCPNCGAEVTRR